MMGIAAFPLYIFASGKPQPAHFSFALFILVLAPIWMRDAYRYPYVVVTLGGFFIWILLRQVIYTLSAVDGRIDVIAFYLFNIILFLATVCYIRSVGSAALVSIYYSTILSVAVAVGGVVISGSSLRADIGDVYRAVGTFNNPNQLGYFSICATGILLSIWTRIGGRGLIIIGALAGCGYLALLSLSKAAMLSMCLYSLCFMSLNWRPRLAVIAVALIAAILFSRSETADFKFVDRLADIGSASDDNLEGRGYGLLLDSAAGLLFGHGEGYAEEKIGHEVHSTLAAVVVNFGAVGLLIFSFFVIYVLAAMAKNSPISLILGLLAPVFFYGITHNGLRFSIFWVLLAVCYGAYGIRDPFPMLPRLTVNRASWVQK